MKTGCHRHPVFLRTPGVPAQRLGPAVDRRHGARELVVADLDEVALAELAEVVAAPAVDHALRRQRAGVVPAVDDRRRPEGLATVVLAAVLRDHVAVVAGLDVGLDEAVAALRGLAAHHAGVGVDHVAVVAGFAGGHVDLVVAARRRGAVGVAELRLDLVVAGLLGGHVDHAVAAHRCSAVEVAGQGLALVVAGLDVDLDRPVAARGSDAGLQARVVVVLVAVVAVLAPLHDRVAAGRQRAAVRAGVVVDVVAVVVYVARKRAQFRRLRHFDPPI